MERMNMSTSPSSSCLPQLGPVTLAPPSHLASVPAGGSELLPHLLPSSANSSPYMSPWDPACVLPLSHEYASHGEASEIAPAASAGPIDTGVAEDARERQNGITDASVAPSLLQRAHPLSLFAPLSRNIQVVCRLRPMTKEKGASVDPKHSERALTVPSSASGRASTNTIHARYPSSLSSTSVNSTGTGNRLAQDFVFDHVFGEDSSQASVFEKIGSQLVHAVCSGFNATILAYGQSSSGKTYTIIGDHASEEGFSDGGAAHGEGIHSSDAQQTCETSERRRRGVPGSDHGDSLGVVKGTPSLSHDGMADGSIGNERTQTRKREDGKTSGSPNVGDGDGLLPRMIQALFTWMKHHEDPRVRRRVLVAAIEIYNENVRDLIGGKCGLKIQRRKHRRKGEGCVSIVGLQEESPQSPVEAFAILDKTIKARRAGSTRMNAESSRSHFIFSLTLEETLLETGDLKVGRLTVVDLAGSERVAKTGSVGATLQEGSMINKSLTCLGKVISTLGAISERAHDTGSSGPSAALSTEGSFTGSSSAIPSAPSSSPPVSQAQQSTAASLPISSFVPYRDSKLTRVLQDALGGNSNTCLILTCSPDAVHMSESLSTLRFGQRAMCVRNTPKVNVERAHDENDVPAIKKHQQIILEYEKFTAHLMTWAHEILLNLVQSQISQGAPYPAYTAVHDGHAPPGLSLSPLSSPLHASSSRDFKESPQQAQGLCRLPSSRNKTQGHTIAASGAEHLKDNGRSSFEKTATDARSSRESLFSALESILSAMPSAPESLMLARPQKADFLSKIKQNVIDLLTMREHDEDEMHDRTGGRHPKNTAMELQKVEGEPELVRSGTDGTAMGRTVAWKTHSQAAYDVRALDHSAGTSRAANRDEPCFSSAEEEDDNYGEEGACEWFGEWGERETQGVPLDDAHSTCPFASRPWHSRRSCNGDEVPLSSAGAQNDPAHLLSRIQGELKAYRRLRGAFRRTYHTNRASFAPLVTPRTGESATAVRVTGSHSDTTVNLEKAFRSTSRIIAMAGTGGDTAFQKKPNVDTLESRSRRFCAPMPGIAGADGEHGTNEAQDKQEAVHVSMRNASVCETKSPSDPHLERKGAAGEAAFAGRDNNPPNLGCEAESSARRMERRFAASSPRDENVPRGFSLCARRRYKWMLLRTCIEKDNECLENTNKLRSTRVNRREGNPYAQEREEQLWLWEKMLQLLEQEAKERVERNCILAYIRRQEAHVAELHNVFRILLERQENIKERERTPE